jgi:signal transduction histidine kinase
MADRERVLVVDDEARNRALVKAFLQDSYEILEADAGPRALEIVAHDPPSLVLLDVMLPGMNGYDVCREIKARTRGYLPIILVTALNTQTEKNSGLAAGADDFLTKPVDRIELNLRVRAFLEIRRQQQALIRLQALKEDLFSLIIHDVRNPLTGLEGYLQLIQDELSRKPDPVLERDVTSALSASRKMRDILDGVLEVRLLEEGALTLQRLRYPVRDLIMDAVATLKGAGDVQRVGIVSSVEGDPAALVDPKLVRRALENLIANAVKYSPRGQQVEVNARGQDGNVEIDVVDHGPGIPEDMKTHMFEKFGSVEAGRGAARRGYGLGLHLVKLAAEVHGGAVSVRDRDGGGSIFRLVLKRAPT